MKNRELILENSAIGMQEKQNTNPMTRTTHTLDIPVYDVLQFLTWDDRFNLHHVVRHFTTNIDSGSLLDCWIYDRLMHESYLVSGDPSADWGDLYKLRNSILTSDVDMKACDGICTLTKAFLASETAIESGNSCSSYDSHATRVVSDDSDDGSEDAGDDKEQPRSLRTRRLMHRLSQSSRNSMPYQLVYSPRMQTVTGLSENGAPRLFQFDQFLATPRDILSGDSILRFINGQSHCVILTGHELDLVETMRQISVDLVSGSRDPIIRRSEVLSPEVFSCDVKLSLIRFFRHKMDTLWSSDSLDSNLGDQVRSMKGLTGHLLFEFVLNFQFTKPYSGAHVSRFVVCIPSQPERARRGLSLDLLALKNCLRAIKSDSTFVPSRDSLLTHWLDMKQFRHIQLVTAVNDSTDTSRIESLNGLRFAEQLT